MALETLLVPIPSNREGENTLQSREALQKSKLSGFNSMLSTDIHFGLQSYRTLT